jgi:hypothetical protein
MIHDVKNSKTGKSGTEVFQLMTFLPQSRPTNRQSSDPQNTPALGPCGPFMDAEIDVRQRLAARLASRTVKQAACSSIDQAAEAAGLHFGRHGTRSSRSTNQRP